jgi:hypothetical protein
MKFEVNQMNLNQIAANCQGQSVQHLEQVLIENGWEKTQESFSSIIFHKGNQQIRLYVPTSGRGIQLSQSSGVPIRRVEGSFHRNGIYAGGLWALSPLAWQSGNGFYVRSSEEYENQLLGKPAVSVA